MSDPKSGSKPDSGLSIPPETENTLSEAAFGQLSSAERARSGHASYQPQTVLADRFRVVRFIARGGMGEVYEAEDLELHERVAVKCIRFEYAHHEHATERFRREIQLARRVTHPSVCRTYDVFRHSPKGAAESGEEILVVSMELLSGRTLSQELREKGKLTPEQSLPIITQMCAGLGAAHQVGIVHRDFKSANVLLVPSEHSPERTRVVITDFGLARDTTSGEAKLTGTLDVVGTPAYMAPEQLNGGEITPATDIYALGIVIYEMLTGSTPHGADSVIAMAMRRLSEPAPSVRLTVPGLDSRWEATVMHCLERQRADRFENTDQIVQTLQGQLAAPPKRPTTKSKAPTERWVAVALLVALLGGGAWFAYRSKKGQNLAVKTDPLTTVAKSRPSVAILGFENETEKGDAGLLGEMLTDGLWSQLDTDEIRFIPPSQVDEMKRNLGMTGVALKIDSKQLAQMMDYLGCDTVITGGYRAMPGASPRKIDWNIHLLGKAEGAGGGSLPITGTESKLNEMVGQAGKKIRLELGVELSAAEETRLDNSLSANPEALRRFSEARENRRKFHISESIIALKKSVAADPKFAQAHSALAEAWADLGYEAKAAEEAKQAVELSLNLSEEARGLITGRYNEMIHDWPKAMENYASLRTVYADDPEYGLLLARSQTSAGKGQAALTVLEQTQQKKNLPAGLGAQLDLARSEAQESLGNYHEQLTAASAASDKAKSLGSDLLLARAEIEQCWALLNLGDPQKAKPLCEQAMESNMKAGDQLGAAHAVNVVANAAYQQGDLAGAKKLYEQALNISQTIGDKLDEAGALNNLANILDDQGDRQGAIRTYQKSIEVAQERGDESGRALAQQNLGIVQFESGNARVGSAMLQSAIQISRKMGDKSTEATVLNNLCFFSLEAGGPGKAMENCESSVRLREEIDSKPDLAKSLVSRGSVQLAQGNLAAARKDYERGLEMLESLGQKADAAYAKIALSRLALLETRYADAAKMSAAAAAELQSEKDAGGEAEARALLALAKAGTNDVAGAQAEIAAATRLGATVTDKKTKLRVEFAAAKIEFQAGNKEDAILTLDRLAKEARTAGLVALGLELNLALGRAEAQAGKTLQGKSDLARVAGEAKARGFVWIAAEAAR